MMLLVQHYKIFLSKKKTVPVLSFTVRLSKFGAAEKFLIDDFVPKVRHCFKTNIFKFIFKMLLTENVSS